MAVFDEAAEDILFVNHASEHDSQGSLFVSETVLEPRPALELLQLAAVCVENETYGTQSVSDQLPSLVGHRHHRVGYLRLVIGHFKEIGDHLLLAFSDAVDDPWGAQQDRGCVRRCPLDSLKESYAIPLGSRNAILYPRQLF